MSYWKQCLQGPLLRLSPAPTQFSRNFSRSTFPTFLEPAGTGYCRPSAWDLLWDKTLLCQSIFCQKWKILHALSFIYFLRFSNFRFTCMETTWQIFTIIAIKKSCQRNSGEINRRWTVNTGHEFSLILRGQAEITCMARIHLSAYSIQINLNTTGKLKRSLMWSQRDHPRIRPATGKFS